MIEIIISLVSLLGMALVARHESRFFGFFLSSVGNILWLILGICTMNVSYLVLFGGYLIFNSIGMLDEYGTWKKIRQYKQKT